MLVGLNSRYKDFPKDLVNDDSSSFSDDGSWILLPNNVSLKNLSYTVTIFSNDILDFGISIFSSCSSKDEDDEDYSIVLEFLF